MSIYLNLVKKDLYKLMVEIDSEEAEEKDLLLVHPQKHVDSIMKTTHDKKNGTELKPK